MNIAKSAIEDLQNVTIDNFDFQSAVCENLNLDNIDLLIEKRLSSSRIINLLINYDFKKNVSEVLGQIELKKSILPDEIPRLLTEQTIKAKGEVWVIHKNDADPFPSSPHAHNYDSGISLHLGTGEFFSKRTLKGILNCKNLRLIRKKITFHTLPALSERCQ